ncbi:DNA-directed DNA polymerase gamma mip1, partial [Coemansia nantahalensis]
MLCFAKGVRAAVRQPGAHRAVRRHSTAVPAAAAAASTGAPTPRLSDLGIVMLAPRLRKSIFSEGRHRPASAVQSKISVDHLKSQGIYGKEGEPVEVVDFDLPDLLGDNIEEHFHRMGDMAAQPYLQMAQEFAQLSDAQFPPTPPADSWVMQQGWTRYGADGTTQRVAAPDALDNVLVFDVEVLVPDSPFPVMAAAVSPRAWYMWVSPYVTGDSPHPRHLVPLTHPDSQQQKQQHQLPRLIIGHNIAYDRARVQEERLLKRPALA